MGELCPIKSVCVLPETLTPVAAMPPASKTPVQLSRIVSEVRAGCRGSTNR